MMKNTYRSLGLALISIILSIAATVLRCISTFTDMDYSTGFYGGSVLIKIANVIIAAAVLIQHRIAKVLARQALFYL